MSSSCERLSASAKIATLPTQIPLFPLRGAVLLPRGRLPLNIFEPRYLAMTEFSLAQGRVIGMIRPRFEDDINPPLYDVGCAGKVTSFAETDDGRYLITLTGLMRFRLKSDQLVDGGFRLGDVSWSEFTGDLEDHQPECPQMKDQVVELLVDYLSEVGLSVDWDSIEGASAETIVNSVAMSCPFEPDEKQALLEAPTLDDRAKTLIAMMQMAVAHSRHNAGEQRQEPLQ